MMGRKKMKATHIQMYKTSLMLEESSAAQVFLKGITQMSIAMSNTLIYNDQYIIL